MVQIEQITEVMLRAAIVYFFLIVAIKMTGKRGIGQATSLDFIIALAIGDIVGEMTYGTESILVRGVKG